METRSKTMTQKRICQCEEVKAATKYLEEQVKKLRTIDTKLKTAQHIEDRIDLYNEKAQIWADLEASKPYIHEIARRHKQRITWT